MEAALEAKKQGKIRYIGFTGHKSPDIHLKMLKTAAAHQFTFDTVQMPLNVMDAHYDSFEKKVLPVLVKDEYRRAGDEVDGRQDHSQEQHGHAGGVPALRHEPADQRRDHRLRFDEDSAAGARRRAQFQADEPERSRDLAGQDRARRRQGGVRTLQDQP